MIFIMVAALVSPLFISLLTQREVEISVNKEKRKQPCAPLMFGLDQ